MKFEIIKRKIKNNWRKLKNIPNSIILCIRFPFLYPRNRFSGLHYNNWKIKDKIKDLWNEAVVYGLNPKNKYTPTIVNYGSYCGYQILKFYHDYILQIIHCIPTYTELDGMEPGWRKAFGIQMCKEIKKSLLKTGGLKLLYYYRIADIKEKWGMLVWSDFGSPKDVQDIINKYESISYKTCIVCGKPATKISTGWISPYCDNCIGNRNYYINDPENESQNSSNI